MSRHACDVSRSALFSASALLFALSASAATTMSYRYSGCYTAPLLKQVSSDATALYNISSHLSVLSLCSILTPFFILN